MPFLYLIRPTRPEMLRSGPTAEEAAAISAHFAYLQAAEADGRLILAGRTQITDDRCFGIAIFNAADEAAAHAFADADPAIRAGVMSVEVFPYQIALLNAANAAEAMA